jgi:regulatory protein
MDPLHAAVAALARRDLTEHELRERLAGQGIEAEEREQVLTRLREAGYVNDARVAAERTERLAARGRGDEAIRAELVRRGIAEDVVAGALAALEPERERAARLLAPGSDPAAQARALARRGFSEESIELALVDVAQPP